MQQGLSQDSRGKLGGLTASGIQPPHEGEGLRQLACNSGRQYGIACLAITPPSLALHNSSFFNHTRFFCVLASVVSIAHCIHINPLRARSARVVHHETRRQGRINLWKIIADVAANMMLSSQRQLFARSERVKGIDFHPTEPWVSDRSLLRNISAHTDTPRDPHHPV